MNQRKRNTRALVERLVQARTDILATDLDEDRTQAAVAAINALIGELVYGVP